MWGALNEAANKIVTKSVAQLENATGLTSKLTSGGGGESSGAASSTGSGGAASGGAVGGAAGGSPDVRKSTSPQNKALAKSGGGSAGGKDSPSNPLADMCVDDTAEASDNVGHILFEMRYNFQETTLALKIVMAENLPAKDLSGTSDPYVRATLLPDKKGRLQTNVKRKTLNPRWNETLYFEGFPIQKLQSRVLHLHVFDYDRFTRDDSIGEVFIPLCQIDFTQSHSFWKPLRLRPKDQCGELLTSLQYKSNKSELTLTIHKARNLKAKDINGKSDPYVKIWLRFGEKRIEKCKTAIYKCTLNPVFDETFTFNVPWEKIRECSLDVMVMDFDNIGRNELIGRLRFAGKSSSGASEARQWQEMIAKPRDVITVWHRLKSE